MIICAGKNEQIKGALPVGVGLLESALTLSTLIRKYNPKDILFVGSAGSYGKFKIFDKVVSCCASQVEISSLLDSSYSPLDNLTIDDVSCETKTVVNSSNYITTNKEFSNIFLKNGYDLENMEFYSVMLTAQKYKINAKGIFIVTNYCDENAHKDFIKNQKDAINLMEKAIEQY